MKRYLRKDIFLVVMAYSLIMLVLACVEFSVSTGDPNILLLEDFSTGIKGWNIWENADGSGVSYFQGGLAFVINTPQYDYISLPKGSFTDLRVEVTANKIVGPDDNDYGIICRYQDAQNYYAFLVTSDGYFGLLKVKDGEYLIMNGEGTLVASDAIRKGSDLNQLKADCIGSVLTFSVNENKLAEVVDTEYSTGRVGLMAGSFENPGVAVLFDNFIVLKP